MSTFPDPQRLSRRRGPGEAGPDRPAKVWMLLSGILLLGAGLLGFVQNPIVGEGSNVLFRTGTTHDLVHIVTGLVALGIGMTSGRTVGLGAIAFGVVYGLVLIGGMLSPTLFGFLSEAINPADDVLHLILAAVSLAFGSVALRQEPAGA